MSTLNLELPPDVRPEEAALLLSVKLFETGRLSLGKAAAMAGCSKRAFIEVLGQHGVPVIAYDPDDLAREMEG